MAAICRERKERYNRESKYKAITVKKYIPCCKATSPLPAIKDMREHYTDRAIEQDLLDLGLERLLPFLN